MIVKIKRWETISELIKKNNFKTYIEVGVARGKSSEPVLKSITDPDFKYYGVDPYISYDEYSNDTNSIPEKIKENYELAMENTFSDPRTTLIRKFSKEASEEFEDGSIDMIFIDANHTYPFVKEDIQLWYPKVKSGGIFSGHDYSPRLFRGAVKKAVDEFCLEYGYKVNTRDDVMWFVQKK